MSKTTNVNPLTATAAELEALWAEDDAERDADTAEIDEAATLAAREGENFGPVSTEEKAALTERKVPARGKAAAAAKAKAAAEKAKAKEQARKDALKAKEAAKKQAEREKAAAAKAKAKEEAAKARAEAKAKADAERAAKAQALSADKLTTAFGVELVKALVAKGRNEDGKGKLVARLGGFKVEFRYTNENDKENEGRNTGYVKLVVINGPQAAERGVNPVKKGQYVEIDGEQVCIALRGLVLLLAKRAADGKLLDEADRLLALVLDNAA